MDCDALIIGGGITGLSAAFKFSKFKISTVLVEPGPLGGVLRSKQKDGFTLELGPNVILEKPEISQLIAELNLRDKLKYPSVPSYSQYVWYGNSPVRIPKTPGALLKTKLLSPLGKLSLLRAFKAGTVSGDQELSVADFFGKALGPEAVSRIMEPALRGIFGGDIHRLSAKALFPAVWKHVTNGGALRTTPKPSVRPKIFTLDGGNDLLIRALVAALPELNIVQDKISRVKFNSQLGLFESLTVEGEIIRSKSVIVATSGAATASYIQSISESLAQNLTALKYAPITVVHCSSDQKILPDASFGVLFPSLSESKILGVMTNSQLFPHVAPPGRQLLTVCLGGMQQPELASLPRERAFELVQSEILKYFGSPVVPMEHTYWQRAIPQYEVGYDALKSEFEKTEQNHPGLYFIGADRFGVGVPDRVKAGYSSLKLPQSETWQPTPDTDKHQKHAAL